MASHIIGNRNSTPEASKSTLRTPASRSLAGNHQLRTSADMTAFSSSPLSSRNIRPSSEVLYNQQSQNQSSNDDAMDRAAQQWIADIDQYETTLEEMAAATLDQDFKDELSAIEQWFRVLSEAERTAALYALLQQTTQVQIRFFIQVLQQMAKSHPMSVVLSPANFGEKGTFRFATVTLIPPLTFHRCHVQPPERCYVQGQCRRLTQLIQPRSCLPRCQAHVRIGTKGYRHDVPTGCSCSCEEESRLHSPDWESASFKPQQCRDG